MNDTQEFQRMIDVMSNPAASQFSRWAFVQSFKHFGLSYIAALQGLVDTLNDGDPIKTEVQQALDELSTFLMDR